MGLYILISWCDRASELTMEEPRILNAFRKLLAQSGINPQPAAKNTPPPEQPPAQDHRLPPEPEQKVWPMMKKSSKLPNREPIVTPPPIIQLNDDEEEIMQDRKDYEEEQPNQSEDYWFAGETQDAEDQNPDMFEESEEMASSFRHKTGKKTTKVQLEQAKQAKKPPKMHAVDFSIEINSDHSFKFKQPNRKTNSEPLLFNVTNKKSSKFVPALNTEQEKEPDSMIELHKSRVLKKSSKIQQKQQIVPQAESEEHQSLKRLKKGYQKAKQSDLVQVKFAICLFEQKMPASFKSMQKNKKEKQLRQLRIQHSDEAVVAKHNQGIEVQQVANTASKTVNTGRSQKMRIEDSIEEEVVEVKESRPLQTGKVSLLRLVEELSVQELIHAKVYESFKAAHSQKDIHDYLVKFQTGRLDDFDFQTFKFTLLDHRRVAELLEFLYPSKYVVTAPTNKEPKVGDFMKKMYKVGPNEYVELHNRIDQISRIKWWSKIMIRNHDKLTELHKEKRRAERKAQKTIREIQQLEERVQSIGRSPETVQVQARSHGSSIEAASRFYSIDEDEQERNKEKERQLQQLELEKKRKFEREKDRQELSRIRNIVSNFGEKQYRAEEEHNRKRVKFY